MVHASFWATRPAVPLVGGLAVGIAAHEWIRIGASVGWVVVLTWAAIATALIRRPRWATVALLLSVFFCGVGLARRQHFDFAADDIAAFVGDDDRLTDLRVYLPDDPRLTTGPPSDPHPSAPRQYVLADVVARADRLRRLGSDAVGQLPVTLDDCPTRLLSAGQTIRDARPRSHAAQPAGESGPVRLGRVLPAATESWPR